jgi:tetratricopeptide (TPR) repeat protein
VLVRDKVAKFFAEALQLYRARRLTEAAISCRRVLGLAPDHVNALHVLGRIAVETEQPAEAVAPLARAAKLQADNPALHALLGTALLQLDRFEEAAAALETAVALNPGIAEAQCALGVALARLEREEPAIAACTAALKLNPDLVQAHFNLANLYVQRRDTAGAIRHYREALRLEPGNAFCHHRLGIGLSLEGHAEEALKHFRTAVRLQPNFVEAQNTLESVLVLAGRWEETVEQYELWVRAEPNSPEAHFDLGANLLMLGRYEEGWPHFEWRWQRAGNVPLQRHFRQPKWQGEDLGQRSLLIHDEQGFGDALQFCRYIPLMSQRCETVIFETRAELLRLFRANLETERVSVIPRVSGYPSVDGLPDTDFQISLLSLPGILGTRVETIPAAVPYLKPDPADARAWADRLAGLPRPRIALVWAGQPLYSKDKQRSITLAQLAPLAQIPGLSFVSLQMGQARAEAATPPPGMVLDDFTGLLRDFADSAALLSAVDLLITVDTSAAHLAGALGRPVWLLNRFLPDWRWLLKRDDSPWYPTLRQFRQPAPEEWDGVIARVAEALSAFAAAYRG